MRYRLEKDKIGELKLPAEAYYGIHTGRSKETFALTKHGLNRQMIKALSNIKKSAAKTNYQIGLLDKKVSEAIILSCDEILNGRLHGQFITDLIQGGSGVSMNMNANEVLANRSNEMLGGKKGVYDLVHPINDVNLNQSSAEVVLLAGKMTSIKLIKKLLTEAKKLSNSYGSLISNMKSQKDDQFSIVNEFKAFKNSLDRDIKKVDKSLEYFHEISIGSSYFETKKRVEGNYIKLFIKNLNDNIGENFIQSKEIIDNSRNLDCFVIASSALRNLVINLSKSSFDMRKMIEDKKISIPQVYETMTSGEINPVVLEMVNQISFYVMGNDITIARSVEAGVYEKNIYLPMIFACLFEMINLSRRTIRTLREKVVDGIIIL
ncbi:MAG: lyase family protein [Bacilli bacterium]|jgi:aspartate ammonia-lyase|nr:lyase family protein [Bacilli bacterium]MDD2681515.1 lyase family protein [Bacilli bacterium]MDD3121048.1 lyase family protein [Bacilli bacterium]MDD4063222.1 lyase family protein [Bacilli bacterium]MDD4481862.1 lyase family protein [Bacilli bacterium]